jgi:hypothetical protein
MFSPTMFADVKAKATANTAQWQAFKSQLDAGLNTPISGGYQASGMALIADYALGYRIFKDTDPATASKYADKACAGMHSAISDYQKGDQSDQAFLARGDGVTKRFVLPDNGVNPATIKAYLAPVFTQSVVRTNQPQDAVNYYDYFLKVSNSNDGSADYVRGVDWQQGGDVGDNMIDWSLPGKKPAVGATYYITLAGYYNDGAPVAVTFDGAAINFATAPTTGQAIFVTYIYGPHYLQTGDADGGFSSIFIDDTYTSRYLGGYCAIAIDWLYDYVGLDSTLKTNVQTMLVRWNDYIRDNGYAEPYIESNYGADAYWSRMLTAIYLNGAGHSAASRIVGELQTYHANNVVPKLTSPTRSLFGGYWAEGWNYGSMATRNIVSAALAYEQAGLGVSTVERAWASQVVQHLLHAHPTATTMYNGGDTFTYPFPDPDNSLYGVLSSYSDDPVMRSYANHVIQSRTSTLRDTWDLLFRDPNAVAADWTTTQPLQYYSPAGGLVLARADWSYASTWLAFHLGNYLRCDHQDYSPGHIQIQRGPDDLLVNANAILENQDQHTKSQLSNLVAVDDNGDGAQTYRWNMGIWYGPDYNTPGVFITTYEATSDHVYFAGDYHLAYSAAGHVLNGGSTSELTRSVLYVRPDLFFIHDRATTIKDAYPKRLQWHTGHAPTVNGNAWSVVAGSSMLSGVTFSSQPLTLTVAPVATGVFRVAITQTTPLAKVRYTTVLQTSGPLAVSPLSSAEGLMEGAIAGSIAVLFGVDGKVSTSFTVTVPGPCTVYVVDLDPSKTWVLVVDKITMQKQTVSQAGVVQFDVTGAGPHTLVLS